MKILNNSEEIKKSIHEVLNKNSDRIIAVAYVGDNAIDYLPNPKNINLYCSTSIPGANPSSLRKLKKEGVEIYEVKKLHSKIYWSKSGGVVICSANLSNNGLSKYGNHEIGVLLPKDSFDVQSYVSNLNSTQINYSDIDQLDKKYNLYTLKNKQTSKNRKAKSQRFQEWDEESGSKWKIYPWSEVGDLPRDVKSELNIKQPEAGYYDFMQTEKSNAYEIGEWVLNIKEVWEKDQLIKIEELSWLVPEIRIKSQQKNSNEYPFYWIQLNKNIPINQPFDIYAKGFKKAFKMSYIELTNKNEAVTLKNNKYSKNFIKLLREYIG
ncbi:MAG: hypothetical protein SRB1_00418 [Desulfobacteraceae bacterium Eth-SRB1]|nr:MAG: hypothetical protein SRB1_00418 [Desulfobacteraceae bacterium Eth-SRB1]